MWKGGKKSGQGCISSINGQKFEGHFADDCPITGELTELDGNVYRVAYDGLLKFSTGALPHSKDLIRSAPCHTNGDGEQGDADGGELDAPKPATLPPLPAGSAGKEDPASSPEWDPFEAVAASVPPPAAVAPAHMRSGRDGAAEEWDPFANSPSTAPPKCAAKWVPVAMESAVELTLPYDLHKPRNHATISAPRFSPEKVASWPDRASTNEALALEQVERQICHELVPHKQRQ